MIKFVANKKGFKKKFPPNTQYIDHFNLYIKDLFEFEYPEYYKNIPENLFTSFKRKFLDKDNGLWAYFEDRQKAYLIPSEKYFYKVLTSRNKPFVSEREQKKYYSFNVGVVGLSIGQSAAISIAKTGGCKNIKIADPDIISPSNLNRIHTGIESVGLKKTQTVKNRLLEINPYQNVITYDEGLTDQNINDFFDQKFKLDMVIDACDYFPIKITIRKLAAKFKIPVLMTTDLGDGILIDLERYDQKKVVPFGGRTKNITKDDDFLSSAIKVISPEFFSIALADSISKIGKEAPTHPQLGSTVFASGSVTAYIVRNIANNKKISDKRILIDFDQHLNPKIGTEKYKKRQRKIINKLKEIARINEN